MLINILNNFIEYIIKVLILTLKTWLNAKPCGIPIGMAAHGLYLLVQAFHPAVCNLEFSMRYNPIEVCLYQTVKP